MVQIYGAQTLAFDSGKTQSQSGVSLMCDLCSLQLFHGVIYLNTHPSLSQVHHDPGLHQPPENTYFIRLTEARGEREMITLVYLSLPGQEGLI